MEQGMDKETAAIEAPKATHAASENAYADAK